MKKIICPFLILGLTLLCLTTGHAQEVNLDTLRAADVNADGTINILDLTFIASHFGKAVAPDQMPNPDVTGDGIVNVLDLVLVAGQLGKTVRPPVAFVSVSPGTESQLEINDTITLTFDNAPEDVTVSTGVATIADETVTIAGTFDPGDLTLTITWKDGSQTLTYTVRQPATFVRARPVVGANLDMDDTITLTFDNAPEDVTVSTGVATIADETVPPMRSIFDPGDLPFTIINKIVTIAGPFDAGPLTLSIAWKDGAQILNYNVRPPVALVRARPAGGETLDVDATITLIFDRRPEDVTVSQGVAEVTGRFVDITGPFDPGTFVLEIIWSNVSHTLTYTVRTPDTEAPEITGGTVSDGNKGIDPDILNSSARIEIDFNEEVSGNIILQTTAGVNVGWIGEVDGKKGTLELVKGKELDSGTTYVITGKVNDAAGNETNLDITFTTASKTSGIPFTVTDATFEMLVLNSEVPVVVEFYTDW